MRSKEALPRSAATSEEEETMIYEFLCYTCSIATDVESRPFHPPQAPQCAQCGEDMDRSYSCQIDTSGCKDHGFIPEMSRVVESDRSYDKTTGVKKEAMFNQAIQKRRAALADGGNKGSFRHTHSVPAELYHGKLKETKDPNYWQDPKNLARHRNTKVD